MADQHHFAILEWRDGNTPVATRFGDPYYALENGLAETQHVFLAGNHLPARFAPGFHIAELGFGTGLNLLCAWAAWRDARHTTALQFTSFEAFPLTLADMARAHAAWPELADLSRRFLNQWNPQTQSIETSTLCLRVIPGDARQTLVRWTGKADAWFLDGFSPAKNPELWQPGVMAQVARHTNRGGSFATYTAAGHVRARLAKAGFVVTRIPGYGRKRHMTTGTLKTD